MKFQYPLLLFLVVPVLLVWTMTSRRHVAKVERARLAFLVAALTFLILACANPYWSTRPAKQVVKGVDLILAIDVSQSMFCPVRPGERRIDEAKNFLRALLPQFSGSWVTLLYFAGDSQIGCPLTEDLSAVYLFLDSITPAMTAQPGTNPQRLQQSLQDLITSIKTSPVQNPKKPLALLFSDGEFSASSDGLKEWLKRQKDFSLFTFLCGKGKAAVPKYDLSAPYPNAISEVSASNLLSLSPARSYDLAQTSIEMVTKDVMQNVNDMILAGDPVPQYRYMPFLILALLFLCLYQIYPLLPQFNPKPATALSAALLLIVLTAISMKPEEKLAIFSGALQEMKTKRYDDALRKLENLRREGASEEVEVAIGNAYLLQGKYDEAISLYEQALRKNPGNQRARWNWEIALKRKQNQNKPPPAPPQPKPQPQPPPEMPRETQALLKYFDQLEKQQMQLTNSINAHNEKFAW